MSGTGFVEHSTKRIVESGGSFGMERFLKLKPAQLDVLSSSMKNKAKEIEDLTSAAMYKEWGHYFETVQMQKVKEVLKSDILARKLYTLMQTHLILGVPQLDSKISNLAIEFADAARAIQVESGSDVKETELKKTFAKELTPLLQSGVDVSHIRDPKRWEGVNADKDRTLQSAVETEVNALIRIIQKDRMHSAPSKMLTVGYDQYRSTFPAVSRQASASRPETVESTSWRPLGSMGA